MHITKGNAILAATMLVVGLGAGFGISAATSSSAPPTAAASTAGGARAPGGFTRGTGDLGGATAGTIASVSGDTLEVQGASSQTAVRITSATSVVKTATEKLSSASLTTGLCVRAVGPTASNGTVTATSIVITAPSSTGSCTVPTGYAGAARSGTSS